MSITVSPDNPNYDSREDCNAIIETESNALVCGCQNTTIPSSVTSIRNAFVGCSGLTSIEIPSSVTRICAEAFYGCSGLTSIEIPSSIISIGGYAFAYCDGLTSIEISDSVTSIGEYAFAYCDSLTSIEIPDSVTNMRWCVFSGCSNLTTIYCQAKSKPAGWYNEDDYDWKSGCSAKVVWGWSLEN
jgi:hypothetical protein